MYVIKMFHEHKGHEDKLTSGMFSVMNGHLERKLCENTHQRLILERLLMHKTY